MAVSLLAEDSESSLMPPVSTHLTTLAIFSLAPPLVVILPVGSLVVDIVTMVG